jgi:hypothetical protein
MTQTHYLLVSAIIFALIFVVHALRLLYGWSAVIGSWTVPAWLSWIALVVSAFLAYQGFRLRK